MLSVLAGCGEKAGTLDNGPTNPTPGRSDEMVPLQAKAVDRGDHVLSLEPESGLAGPTVTQLHVSPDPSDPTIPGEDWSSETLSERAVAQLRRLLEEPGTAKDIAAADYQGSELWTDAMPIVYRRGDALVRRMEGVATVGDARGPEALTKSLRALSMRFGQSPRVEWKPIGIELEGAANAFTTRVLVEMAGEMPEGGHLEMHATWECQWKMETPPRLARLRLAELEGVRSLASPWFADVSASVFQHVPNHRAQIMMGIEDWSQRITRYGDMYLTGHHGLALGDVNGDGRDDVYVCDGGSLPNRLYLQQADGTVREASAASGVDFLEDSRGALLIDLDNDGDQDLVVATVAIIALAENDGAGQFTLRGGHMGAPYPAAISAADADLDGDLDLYACAYEAGDSASRARGFEARTPIPFHDAKNGGRNVLLENLGDFQFVDSTASFGLDDGNTKWSFTAAWEDFDRDGDPDLYVANDFGRNDFFRNDGGHFVNIAAEAGVEDMAAGMSVSWGDYNRDGHADLYVGNMFSPAGRRVSYQRHFLKGRKEEDLLGTQRMARGNSLFAARDSSGAFDDVSEAAGVTMGRWAWSSAFADLNNDGWEDLLVVNGYLTNRQQEEDL